MKNLPKCHTTIIVVFLKQCGLTQCSVTEIESFMLRIVLQIEDQGKKYYFEIILISV